MSASTNHVILHYMDEWFVSFTGQKAELGFTLGCRLWACYWIKNTRRCLDGTGRIDAPNF